MDESIASTPSLKSDDPRVQKVVNYSEWSVHYAIQIIQFITSKTLETYTVAINQCVNDTNINDECVDKIVYAVDEPQPNKDIIDAIKDTLRAIIEVNHAIEKVNGAIANNNDSFSTDFAKLIGKNLLLSTDIKYLYDVLQSDYKRDKLKELCSKFFKNIKKIRDDCAECVNPLRTTVKKKHKKTSFKKETECNSNPPTFEQLESKIGQYLAAVNKQGKLGCGYNQFPKYEGNGKYCCSDIQATDQETLNYVNNLIVEMIDYANPHSDKAIKTFNSDMQRLRNKRTQLLPVNSQESNKLEDSLAIPGIHFKNTLDQWHRWVFLLTNQDINPWVTTPDILKNVKDDKTGETLLMFAVKNQYPLVVDFLVNTVKVDIQTKDDAEKNAIDYANELPDSEEKTKIISMINSPPNSEISLTELSGGGKRKTKKRPTRKRRKPRRQKKGRMYNNP